MRPLNKNPDARGLGTAFPLKNVTLSIPTELYRLYTCYLYGGKLHTNHLIILLLPIGIIYSTKGIGQVIIVYSINFNYNLNTIKVLPTAVIITHIEVL